MTVDVRAKVFCNLGTVIQASVADEALSARQGLIRCRGQVVLQGLHTPRVGSFVYFGWERDGTVARIPRTLRVLSSFADPFRNQTTVQLGDKLVYLANLRGKKADPTEQEEKPETPDKPPTPEPQDGPAPEEFPQSEYDYNAPDSCYAPKPGETPFLFGTKEAAETLQALEPYLMAPASIKKRTALTIKASSVLAKCLAALGIARSGASLIAQFTEDSFDLSSGYVNVIDQLLANESLYGYLNENEVLVVGVVSSSTGSGPLITSDTLIDLTGVNQGLLPGQQVAVNVEATDLKPELPPEPDTPPDPDAPPDPEAPPEADPGPNQNWDEQAKPPKPDSTDEQQKLRNWEYEQAVGYNLEARFFLEDGFQVTFPYNTLTEVYTYYDEHDYVTKRITKTYSIVAAEAGSLLQAKLQAEYNGSERYQPSTELQSFATREIRSGSREEYTYKVVKQADQGIPEPELLCPGDEPRVVEELPPQRVEKVPVTQTTYVYQSSLALLGQLNITGVDWAEYDLSTLPNYDVLVEQSVVTYYQNEPSGQTKSRVDRFIIHGNTQEGQQDTAEKGKETTDQNGINRLLDIASELRLDSTNISIQQDRTYGVQKRPSPTDLAKEDLKKEPQTGSEKDTTTNTQVLLINQQSETTESQPNLQLDMPYGSDDGFIWTASDGFQFSGGNAGALALRYARTQNAILRGNRSGVSLQLPAYAMPLYPLSWVYLQAASVTGGYRSNGMSWAMNSDGVLCAMDALFFGGVSGSGTAWFPTAPGITTLPADPAVTTGTPAPANAMATPSGFDPTAPGSIWSSLPAGQAPTYSQSITPTALVPVVTESVPLVAAVKSVLDVQVLDYSLTLPTGTAVLVTKAEVTAATHLAAAAAAFAFSAQAVGLSYVRRLAGTAGSVTSTGYSAGSVRSYGIGTNAGTFALSGQNAVVKRVLAPLTAEAGSFALTGQNATSSGATTMSAAVGGFSLSGQAANSIRSYRLSSDANSFAASGKDAQLNKTVPVVLLLHMNGTNNSTTFTDSSTYARTVTPAGTTSAYITTAQSKFGGASGYFVNAPYLSIADAAELGFGDGDFTIECWVRMAQTIGGTFKMIASQATSSTSNFAWALWYSVSSPTNIGFSYSSDGTTRTTVTSNTTLSNNVWYHVAVVRSGIDLKMYINGTQIGSTHTIGTASIYDSTANLLVASGYAASPSNFWYGYLDEMRISKVAQYTANFTAPTAEFPNP